MKLTRMNDRCEHVGVNLLNNDHFAQLDYSLFGSLRSSPASSYVRTGLLVYPY